MPPDHVSEDEGVELHGPTLDHLRSMLRSLAVQRMHTHIRVIAGDGSKGIFYWGFDPMQAREFAARLLEAANAIQPISTLN